MRHATYPTSSTARPRVPTTTRGGARTASPSHLDALRRGLILLESVVSVSGLGGGVFMASHPLTVMPLRYLEGTWFHTWRWPGVALLVFVGICPALAVVATLQRRRIEGLAHLMVGVGLVAWIVLEAAWMVVSLPLQAAVASIGVAIIVLALGELRRTRERSPLAARAPHRPGG